MAQEYVCLFHDRPILPMLKDHTLTSNSLNFNIGSHIYYCINENSVTSLAYIPIYRKG